ncbi:MAG: zinc metallopeptidase [Bacilli bacterium]|nr:zinc metallopeptidase [Bacilli bacterium]
MGYYELSYVLMFVSILITIIAQIYVSASYSKYKKVENSKGITGAEAAREILDKHGLKNVYVTETRGMLSDHYDSQRKVVRLSSDIYHGKTVAAVSVAAHEVGHAIQDKEGYGFMKFRHSLFPLVNFSSKAGYFAILFGIIFGCFELIWIGIILEVIILFFQLVTLPVEFNASKRAANEIKNNNFLVAGERKGSKKMLNAAAFTYVASVLTTLLQIFRLLLMVRSDD